MAKCKALTGSAVKGLKSFLVDRMTAVIYCIRQSWLNIRSDARQSSSSLPAVCTSRDQPNRKSGVLPSRKQQSTDSAIGASLEEIDDTLCTSSSSSSRLSLLQLHATPRDVTSGHVTPFARLRRGMTLSGDDLFPARLVDDICRSAADDTAKHRNKPSEPTSEAVSTVIHSQPELQPRQQDKERVSMSAKSQPLNALIRRHVDINNYQQYNTKDEDSDKSTSGDYTSDYEDSGTTFRWRDDSSATPRRLRDVQRRRSYGVTRRRRDVKRSHSDTVRTSRWSGRCRTGQDVFLSPRSAAHQLDVSHNATAYNNCDLNSVGQTSERACRPNGHIKRP